MRSLREWIAWADRCSTVSVVEISPKQCGELRDMLASVLTEMELTAHVVTHPVPAPVKPDVVLLNAPYTPNQEEWRARMDQLHSNPRALRKTPCAACRGQGAESTHLDGTADRRTVPVVCGRCRGSGVE